MRSSFDDGSTPATAGKVGSVSSYEFTLVLDPGPGGLSDAIVEQLYEAGLDDALVGESAEVTFADFTRTAATLLDAVLSAIDDVQKVGSVRVVRVEPNELVTLADIAERLGRTQESVRLLVNGQRGPGGFPPAISRVGSNKSRVWRWADVVGWMSDKLRGEVEWNREEWASLAVLNDMLMLRNDIAKAPKDVSTRIASAIAGLIPSDIDVAEEYRRHLLEKHA
jgi:hypothetical protein